MKYTIRELSSNEYKILEDFLYEAIFIPEGVDSPSRDIIKQPELQLYISEFGKEDDNAFVAEIDGKVVGAVWTRIMNDTDILMIGLLLLRFPYTRNIEVLESEQR